MTQIIQKRLAAQILKCSPKRVKLDKDSMEDIKKAITKADIKSLIVEKAIKKAPVKGISKVRVGRIRNKKGKEGSEAMAQERELRI